MDYEKKNKDAISTIKQALRQLATNGVPIGNMIEAMKDIEEKYAESEDERIRKEMIFYFQEEILQCSIQEHADKMKKFIAWLEKKGEHKNFFNKIQIGDKVTRNRDGVLVNLSQLKRVAKPAEEQGEQKFPIEKLPSEMKTIGESLGFTTQEECDRYNQMVTDRIMSDDDKGEQKAAWSEEDEVKMNRIVACLENLNVADNDILLKDVGWFKSLKERVQSQWKPSDEQMKMIDEIINTLSQMQLFGCRNALIDLKHDLKKLREE